MLSWGSPEDIAPYHPLPETKCLWCLKTIIQYIILLHVRCPSNNNSISFRTHTEVWWKRLAPGSDVLYLDGLGNESSQFSFGDRILENLVQLLDVLVCRGANPIHHLTLPSPHWLHCAVTMTPPQSAIRIGVWRLNDREFGIQNYIDDKKVPFRSEIDIILILIIIIKLSLLTRGAER